MKSRVSPKSQHTRPGAAKRALPNKKSRMPSQVVQMQTKTKAMHDRERVGTKVSGDARVRTRKWMVESYGGLPGFTKEQRKRLARHQYLNKRLNGAFADIIKKGKVEAGTKTEINDAIREMKSFIGDVHRGKITESEAKTMQNHIRREFGKIQRENFKKQIEILRRRELIDDRERMVLMKLWDDASIMTDTHFRKLSSIAPIGKDALNPFSSIGGSRRIMGWLHIGG